MATYLECVMTKNLKTISINLSKIKLKIKLKKLINEDFYPSSCVLQKLQEFLYRTVKYKYNFSLLSL